MTTHICLISEQPIPNLIPLRLEKPARAVLLVSEEMEQQAARLKGIVQAWGIVIEEHRIPPFDLQGVATICDELIRRHGKDRITLNVTGGTKVSALAAFEACYSAGCRIIYVNSATDEILTLAPREETTTIPELIGVREYLAAYGLAMNKDSGQPPADANQRRRQTKALAELLINNDALLTVLNRKTQPFLSNEPKRPSYLHLAPGDFDNANSGRLLQLLREAGVASEGLNDGVNVNDPRHIFYLGGGWLEEFVYHTVQELHPKDVRINVEVAWDGAGRKPTTNEFDVLFTRRNRLHVISCKAANLKEEISGGKAKAAIYELDALADKAGGLFGKNMLVSARPLSEYDQARAARMGMRVVCGRDVLQLKNAMRQWIG